MAEPPTLQRLLMPTPVSDLDGPYMDGHTKMMKAGGKKAISLLHVKNDSENMMSLNLEHVHASVNNI